MRFWNCFIDTSLELEVFILSFIFGCGRRKESQPNELSLKYPKNETRVILTRRTRGLVHYVNVTRLCFRSRGWRPIDL